MRARPAYAVPVLVGLATVIGLAAALLGDGGYDALSWAGLGVPAAIGLWPLVRRGRRAA